LKKQSKTGSQTAVNIAKTAVLELDGKQHRLIYDFNAICAAESVAGCNAVARPSVGGHEAVQC